MIPLRPRIATGRVELLARLRDGAQVVGPTRFISLAERSGTITAIDTWALDTALLLIDQLGDAVPYRVHVNASAHTLVDADYQSRLVTTLSGWRGAHLAVELTETSTVIAPSRLAEAAQLVRDQGSELWLDDFGVGFSSLELLRSLPVSGIKLDGSLTAEVAGSPVHAAVVRGVCGIARELGLGLVAEHVLDEATESWLRDVGVEHAQGDRYGRDLHAEQAVRLLRDGWEATAAGPA